MQEREAAAKRKGKSKAGGAEDGDRGGGAGVQGADAGPGPSSPVLSVGGLLFAADEGQPDPSFTLLPKADKATDALLVETIEGGWRQGSMRLRCVSLLVTPHAHYLYFPEWCHVFLRPAPCMPSMPVGTRPTWSLTVT